MEQPPLPEGWTQANWDRYWNGLSAEQKALYMQGMAPGAQSGRPNVAPSIPQVGVGSSMPNQMPPRNQQPIMANQSMPSRGVGQAQGGGVGGWFKDNWMPLVGLGLGAWSAYEGHKSDKRADQLSQEALDFKRRQYEEMTPMRLAAMDKLKNAQRPDLGELTYDEGNPYSRSRRIPRVGRGV